MTKREQIIQCYINEGGQSTVAEIGAKFGVTGSYVSLVLHKARKAGQDIPKLSRTNGHGIWHDKKGKPWRKLTVDGKAVFLHTHVWEQHHGPVPKGRQLRFIDGDTLNCDISNLQLHVPRRLAPKEGWRKRVKADKKVYRKPRPASARVIQIRDFILANHAELGAGGCAAALGINRDTAYYHIDVLRQHGHVLKYVKKKKETTPRGPRKRSEEQKAFDKQVLYSYIAFGGPATAESLCIPAEQVYRIIRRLRKLGADIPRRHVQANNKVKQMRMQPLKERDKVKEVPNYGRSGKKPAKEVVKMQSRNTTEGRVLVRVDSKTHLYCLPGKEEETKQRWLNRRTA